MAIVQRNYIPTLSERLEKGGLAQIVSLKGGSRTWFALSCLGHFLDTHTGDPPLSLWLSNEGELYPEAIRQYWEIPLSRMLLIRAKSPEEVWQTALDAVQTGLFMWMFIKTERSGQNAQMRKLQLAAEKTKTRILILCQAKIPHWNLRTYIQVTPETSESLLLTRQSERSAAEDAREQRPQPVQPVDKRANDAHPLFKK